MSWLDSLTVFFMKIIVLDAQSSLYEGFVSEAILPAKGGELTIMDDHEPIFVALRKGSIRLTPLAKQGLFSRRRFSESASTGEIKPIFVNGGLARMKRNELIVLVE